jgi:5-methylcytosine-specific restriction endonuclease McrA
MRAFSLSHLSDQTLLQDLAALVARDRVTTADLLAHLGEVDERQLHLPAGHSSMYAYCVRELHFSEQAAYRRIEAARRARQFPALLAAIADGRLHLTAVLMLGPHLREETARDLITAAAHKSKTELEELLAERFPKPDVPSLIRALLSPSQPTQPSPSTFTSTLLSPAIVGTSRTETAPTPARIPAPRKKMAPLSPERFALQATVGKGTHDKLRSIQALLSHLIPSGDLERVLDYMADLTLRHLEKRKFGTTSKPRTIQGSSGTNKADKGARRQTSNTGDEDSVRRSITNPRYIPNAIRRAVRERDQDRCTFVSHTGHRCESGRFLEFDHIEPVARGGRSTIENLRLRCRAHNQYQAEQAFGVAFMSNKRRCTSHGARGEETARAVVA